MMYVKFLDYFDQKIILSTLNFGGRPGRASIQLILSPGATVSKTQMDNARVVYVFFDKE